MSVISFLVIVCLLLVLSANRAPLSKMDDRQGHGAVTNLSREFFGAGKHPKVFVTFGRSRLSSFLVWTGFALHG
jgi:hypothetical protein